jgi:hypothetical protein
MAAEKPVRTIDCGTQGCPEGQSLSRVQAEGDALVKKYCTTCHTESRIMDRLSQMRKSRDIDFARDVKSIVVKKIRLTGGGISHGDGKKILEYLVTL